MLLKYAASIQYQGTHYYGWQCQENLPTVAAKLEAAIAKIADHPIKIHGAGRTDKGVHAISQIIHFETQSKRKLHHWLLGVNRYLPNDISLNWIVPIDQTFHARFSALARRYIYLLYPTHTRPALGHQFMAWTHKVLDVHAMHQAAQHLIGEHDFTTFRSHECQSTTPVRAIHHIKIEIKDQLIVIDVQANAFLHHMVRNIVGSLMEVGQGKQPADWMCEILQAKDRNQAGKTAPAEGLYLAEVTYPETYALPQVPAIPSLNYSMYLS